MIKSKEDVKKFNKRKKSKDSVKAATKIELKEGEAIAGNYHDNYDVVDDATECDPAAGDYLDGDRACGACSARMLCVLNAVRLGNIVRDSLNPKLQAMLDTANPNDINSLISDSSQAMAIPSPKNKKKKKHRVGKLK